MAKTPNRRKEAKLCWLTYSQIGKLTNHTPRTVQEYAFLKIFNPRNHRSCMEWINKRRAKLGWAPYGIEKETPEKNKVDTCENVTPDVKPLPETT